MNYNTTIQYKPITITEVVICSANKIVGFDSEKLIADKNLACSSYLATSGTLNYDGESWGKIN